MTDPNAARNTRPGIHFTAPRNWLNDPNGLSYIDGTYHLFYQYNPHSTSWARPYWGHATSPDLINWEHLPVALAPDSQWDIAGCFSGCCVVHDGVPTIVYTGIRPISEGSDVMAERVLIATSDDGLRTWTKRTDPVIDAPPADLDAVGFRDPFLWKDTDGTWLMVIGSGSATRGGMALSYRSSNLIDWEYIGVLLEQEDLDDNPLTQGTVWECPQLTVVDGRAVLVVSVCDENGPQRVVTITGELDGAKLNPAAVALTDIGNSLYAPHFLRMGESRTVMFSWLREVEDGSLPEEWAGAMSLPWDIVSVPGSATGVGQTIVPELKSYRGEPVAQTGPLLEGRYDVALNAGPVDVEISMTTHAGASFRMVAIDSSGVEVPGTNVHIDCDAKGLTKPIERAAPAKSGVDRSHTPIEAILRVVVDHSIIEVETTSGVTATRRFYPAGADVAGLRIEADGDDFGIVTATSWQLAIK